MGNPRPDLARPAHAPRRPTVLIVDDDPSLRDTLEVVQRALIKQGSAATPHIDGGDATRALDSGMVIGKSPKMRELVESVGKVAPSPATVLVQGESGTGKELLAQLVHRWSPRSEKAFV